MVSSHCDCPSTAHLIYTGEAKGAGGGGQNLNKMTCNFLKLINKSITAVFTEQLLASPGLLKRIKTVE